MGTGRRPCDSRHERGHSRHLCAIYNSMAQNETALCLQRGKKETCVTAGSYKCADEEIILLARPRVC